MRTRGSGWLAQRWAAAGTLRRSEGQSLVELALLVPILLVIFMGIVEAATAYDRQHALEGLSREGANIASRGAQLSEVVELLEANGASIGLADVGGVVVSRVFVTEGAAEIVQQEGSAGYAERSRVGALGDPAVGLSDLGLAEGRSVHVVELFYPYDAITPLGSFVAGAIPQGLYSRAVF
jgi:hypothetical protein